jgi:hypothetical protein
MAAACAGTCPRLRSPPHEPSGACDGHEATVVVCIPIGTWDKGPVTDERVEFVQLFWCVHPVHRCLHFANLSPSGVPAVPS